MQRPLAKAREIEADDVIVDLEDAVAPDAKEEGRRTMQAALAGGAYRSELVVRINGLDTEWTTADVVAAVEAHADAILVPEVSGPRDVKQAARELASAGAPRDMRLWAMIETPLALLNLRDIAASVGTYSNRRPG